MGMIPEAAVEAAAEWLPHSGECEARPERGCTCWRSRVDLMSAALEAAAPHMLAPYLAAAWAEGHSVGRADDWSLERNPYRPTP